MIAEILRLIDANQRFLVAAHSGPDGDALASTLALTLLLREQGKDVVAFNADGVPAPFTFLPGADTLVSDLTDLPPFEVGFLLDAGELRRAGADLRACCSKLVNIDHHPHSESFGDINYVDERASATGALIYRLLKQAGWELTRPVAECIYTAILSDTGSFRYSNADPEAFAIAGELIGCGVSPWDAASRLYETQPAARLRLLAKALETLAVSPCGRIASVATTLDMMRATGTGPEHTDGFVNYPRSVDGVQVALYFRQLDSDTYKIGFRSKGQVDVGYLSRQLGGGGHHNAAGATLQGSLETVQNQVLPRLLSLLP